MKTYELRTPDPAGGVDFSRELNPQQLDVVLAGDGPRLVIAGAGSGKTRTLTYRVAALLARGVPARGVLLCTFTNKAAREMLARVEHLVGAEVRRVWGGTFHHLANRLLREHAALAGFSPGFTILDQEDARELLGDCLTAQARGQKALAQPAVVGELLGLAVNTRVAFEPLVLARAPALVNQLDDLSRAVEAYRARKRAMDAMDFDDLLEHLRSLLSARPELAEQLSGRFLHVLVDEYQDTSPLQVELVDRLAAVHRNLTVVGDDAQSIYAFRGASPEAILGFSGRWPEATLHKLETNYRSTPAVLSAANAAIAANRRQIPKTLRPARPDGGPRPALAPVTDAAMEARFVAQRVLELRDEGHALADQAVLYRAHHHGMELQLELTRRGIPYQVRSGLRFFESAHVKDVLAFLRLLENPRDELAWLRVLRLQPGLGRASAQRILQALRESPDPFRRALDLAPPAGVSGRAAQGYAALRACLARLDTAEQRASGAAAIETVLASGYAARLPELYSEPDARLEDLLQLGRYAERFENLRAFLSELSLLAGVGAEELREPGAPEDLLTLSSVHQAKGLEWYAVFVLALDEGAFPHPRAAQEPDGLEEERRLFYVAITRAKDELYLLSRQVADRPGRRQSIQRPSRFLAEVEGADCLERWSVRPG
jgi:DNA helicase II / ATP-dependent DNA helicase PcrA